MALSSLSLSLETMESVMAALSGWSVVAVPRRAPPGLTPLPRACNKEKIPPRLAGATVVAWN